MSFDKFLLAFESCDLSQADQRLQYIRLNSKRIVSAETIRGNALICQQVHFRLTKILIMYLCLSDI